MFFNKKHITSIIGKKLRGIINSFHIFSVINIFLDELVKELQAGKKVKISGFGTFELIDLKSKKIVNIITGKVINTKPSKSLRFRLSDKFKQHLNDKDQV